MCVTSFESLPEPNSQQKLLLGTIFLLPVIIGCVGNITAIVIVARVLRSRQTVPNVSILVLAWVDLLTIGFVFIPALLNYLSGLSITHAPLCTFLGSLLNFLYLLSITLVSCLSFDRYLALYSPFFYKAHVTEFAYKKFAFVLVVLTSLPMAISLLPSLGLGKHVLQYPGTFCMFQVNPTELGGKITLNTNLTFLLSCMLVIVACNSAVSWKSYKMLQRSRDQRPSLNTVKSTSSLNIICSTDECQFLKLSVIAMTSFLCCWTVWMIRLIMIETGSPLNSCWDLIAVALVTLHNMSNPWMYLLTRRQYRKAFWYMVKKSVCSITCNKFCVIQGGLDDILGLTATKIHSGKVEKKSESKENLYFQISASTRK